MSEQGSYALARHVVRQALTIDTIVRELPRWRAAHPTRDEAELFVARKVHELLLERYQRCALSQGLREMVKLSLDEVCFRWVAKVLLKKLTRESDPRQLAAARRWSCFT